jgi:hypothetical protein
MTLLKDALFAALAGNKAPLLLRQELDAKSYTLESLQ